MVTKVWQADNKKRNLAGTRYIAPPPRARLYPDRRSGGSGRQSSSARRPHSNELQTVGSRGEQLYRSSKVQRPNTPQPPTTHLKPPDEIGYLHLSKWLSQLHFFGMINRLSIALLRILSYLQMLQRKRNS